jgi:hypothetical protein
MHRRGNGSAAGNVFDANGAHGIHVIGNSGINLADSSMRLLERPNTTTTPNGSFGIRCDTIQFRKSSRTPGSSTALPAVPCLAFGSLVCSDRDHLLQRANSPAAVRL